jgi:hypothetical protein
MKVKDRPAAAAIESKIFDYELTVYKNKETK